MEVILNVEIKHTCNISTSHFLYLACSVKKFWRHLFTDRWNFEDKVLFGDLDLGFSGSVYLAAFVSSN